MNLNERPVCAKKKNVLNVKNVTVIYKKQVHKHAQEKYYRPYIKTNKVYSPGIMRKQANKLSTQKENLPAVSAPQENRNVENNSSLMGSPKKRKAAQNSPLVVLDALLLAATQQ
jgi:hypothetical protein